MNRRLISCLVLLLLVLQNAAMASSADASSEMSPDCAERMAQADPDCCNELCTTPADCVVLCAVCFTSSFASVDFDRPSSNDSFAFFVRISLDPQRAPPNPPPIA
jgi:hypothetical protein